jgi:hypothetical protein
VDGRGLAFASSDTCAPSSADSPIRREFWQYRDVPSTLLGLTLFAVLLTPGLAFVLARERHRPERSLSAFRETAVVACASLAADLVALAGFAAIRAVAPGLTPDIGQLVRTPGNYLRIGYLPVFWWGVVLFAIATGLGAAAGSGLLRRVVARGPLARLAGPAETHDSGVSAWWLLFNEHPEAEVHVGCLLNDGSFVSGWLHSFSNLSSDSPDRDLTLAPPIRFRPVGSLEAEDIPRLGAAAVSARQVSVLFVSYVRRSERAEAGNWTAEVPDQ